MKKAPFVLILISLLFFPACNTKKQDQKDQDAVTVGASYFGQNPPGMTAEIFAPGVVSVDGRYEYAVSFSPDAKEFYFSGEKEDEPQTVYFSELKEGEWTQPQAANFTKGRKKNEFEAFVSPGGDKLYFAAYDSIFFDEKIWEVNRSASSWSDAIQLDSPINEDLVFYPNAAANGDLFYTSISKGKMYYAPNKNGHYPDVHELGIEYGIHGFISPSQDFILVDARRENDRTKDRDIYVCFKKYDGTWSKPINLGDRVNSDFNETCPSLTPDGKYLFFSRYNEEGGLSNIYWVSAEVITKVKNEHSTNIGPLTLEGPYMGQKPPGLVAEPFAPGIISKEGWELEGVFAPGMKEFYYTTSPEEPFSPTVIGYRQQDGIWKKFTEFKRTGEVTFSPDGMRMHMAKGYKDRVGDGWTERKSLGPLFDRDDWGIMRLSASSKGTYVFDDYKSNDVIRISAFKDGKRQEPVKMGPAINSGTFTAHPFIAPDESYLIFDSKREGGFGDSDLYISFKQMAGSWGPAINMGEAVNSDRWEAFATVTADGKYILFNKGVDDNNDNVDIYWVDARVIEELRNK